MDTTLNDLARLLNLSQAEIYEIRRKIRRVPTFKPVVVLEDLSWDAFSALNLNLPYLSGIEPLVGQKRVYPHAQSVAHLVGFVGTKTREDLQRVNDIVGDYVGRSGVERDFERDCAARPVFVMSRSMRLAARCANCNPSPVKRAATSPCRLIWICRISPPSA